VQRAPPCRCVGVQTLKALEPGEQTKCPLASGHHCTINNPQFSVRKYEREFNATKWVLCRCVCACICMYVGVYVFVCMCVCVRASIFQRVALMNTAAVRGMEICKTADLHTKRCKRPSTSQRDLTTDNVSPSASGQVNKHQTGTRWGSGNCQASLSFQFLNALTVKNTLLRTWRHVLSKRR
jgi:hypothetical protein